MKNSDGTCNGFGWPVSAKLVKEKKSVHLFSWMFTYINQVAEMPGATAEQQLVSSNLQPTNLLSRHNTCNCDTTTNRDACIMSVSGLNSMKGRFV